MIKIVANLCSSWGGGINYFLGNYKKNSVNKTTKDKSKRLISL